MLVQQIIDAAKRCLEVNKELVDCSPILVEGGEPLVIIDYQKELNEVINSLIKQ